VFIGKLVGDFPLNDLLSLGVTVTAEAEALRAEAWPMGVFVKRYFLPRNVINSETESSEPCDV